MKQNEEIEQKKWEDSKRLRSKSQQSVVAQNADKKSAVISKLEEEDLQQLQGGGQSVLGENSMDAKTLRLAEELLEEINEFIENLWRGQQEAASADAQDDARSLAQSSMNPKDQAPRPLYKFDKDFSVELQHYLDELTWVTS